MKLVSTKAYAFICILFISNQVLTEKKDQDNSIDYLKNQLSENSKLTNNSRNNLNNNISPNNYMQNDTNIKEADVIVTNKTNENIVIDKNSSINSINPAYNNYGMKYHSFEINFISSFFRSFSLLLVSEVMDKSFIIILYFSTKLPPVKVLFFSGISLVFMNSISIIIGYSLPSLLYRSLIEWIALISFIFLSFAYVNEAYHLEDETHEQKFTKTLKNERRSKLLERRTSLTNIRFSNKKPLFKNFFLNF
jgi:putative Ca2+/H+ antiporter (TMEM165/GDT1 family)